MVLWGKSFYAMQYIAMEKISYTRIRARQNIKLSIVYAMFLSLKDHLLDQNTTQILQLIKGKFQMFSFCLFLDSAMPFLYCNIVCHYVFIDYRNVVEVVLPFLCTALYRYTVIFFFKFSYTKHDIWSQKLSFDIPLDN